MDIKMRPTIYEVSFEFLNYVLQYSKKCNFFLENVFREIQI